MIPIDEFNIYFFYRKIDEFKLNFIVQIEIKIEYYLYN
jgi:hypothetical protein